MWQGIGWKQYMETQLIATIVFLAGALQSVSIYLFRTVQNENRELKEVIKESNTASAATNAVNAALAAKYPEVIERMDALLKQTLQARGDTP